MEPTFLIIGSAKCGTSSLHFYLAQHPDVTVHPDKEPNFFIRDRTPEETAAYIAALGTGTARGEASTGYTMHPRLPGVPERIHALAPGTRLIFLVGDPIAKFKRQWRQNRSAGAETRTFARFLADAQTDPDHAILAQCRYALQLTRFLDVFDADAIQVVDQDDLRRDRARVVADAFGFIGVDPAFQGRLEHEVNQAQDQRVWGDVGRTLRRSGAIRTFRRIPPNLRRPVVTVARRLLSDPTPTIDEQADARADEVLRGLLADDLARFRELTGREFPHWSL